MSAVVGPAARPHRGPTVTALLLVPLGLLASGLAGCGVEGSPALAAANPPRVRVLLRRDGGRVSVENQAWQLVQEGRRGFLREGRGALAFRPHVGRRGVALGSEETGAAALRLRVERDFAIDDTHYAGELVIRVEDGRLRLVNEVDMETYVAGVIPNEMAPGAPPAAYRAQAVAARTYVWMRVNDDAQRRQTFDVYDTQSSQVYMGLSPHYDVSMQDMFRRVSETRGVVLTWQNEPFPAYYSSTCGGHTTDPQTSLLEPGGATVPLRGVRCDFCTTSPKYAWEVEFSDQDLVEGLERRRRPIAPPVRAIEVSSQGAGGWAREITITYGPEGKKKVLPGTEFRSALKLQSHRILSITHTGGRWQVKGRGWGHGVGMCQWGAMEMGRRGLSESEILRWYYPGAAFTRLY